MWTSCGADWQRQHPGEGYLPVTGALAGHNLHDAMQPWAGMGEIVRPSTVLDHHALGYGYDTEPECGGKASPKIEKIEIKEGKLEKLEKVELKELKHEKLEKPERKEAKHEKFEKLEQWENKALPEKDPLGKGKDFGEGPIDELGLDVVQPAQASSLEESVRRLEDTVNELRHFIGTQLRPDLARGALRDEPDLGEGTGSATEPDEDDEHGR